MSFPKSRKQIDDFTEKYKNFKDSDNLLFAIETLDGNLVGRTFMDEICKTEAVFRENCYLHGKYCDEYLFGLLENEFKELFINK